ncbi:response regulator [Virgibacillus kekensis]|uniref:Response regulator n=1 Tax=Virgibacillus kekensis TaxID=202261 RepID=A0ABV9DGY8_9BACI
MINKAEKKILVVDDQLGIRLLLQEVFSNEGYQVKTVQTGQEALDVIYEESFDLLMLDYKLPVVDGVQVLQQLDRDNYYIPTIVMSGLAEDIIKESQRFSLVKKVLPKPFNVQDVCGIAEELMSVKG